MEKTVSLFLFTACLFLIMGCPAESDRKVDKESSMEMDKLREMVLNLDWEAVDLAEQIGSPAVAELTDLLRNEDAEVRDIALNCIVMTNNDTVKYLLADALEDADETVRATAIQSLQPRNDISLLPKLTKNLNHPEASIRGAVAIMIGDLGETKSLKDLRDRLQGEADEEVIYKIKLAAAKLGDEKYKDEFGRKMSVPDSETRFQALIDLEYIGDKKMAVYLGSALDDFGPAYGIGHPEDPQFARVCDAAVNLLSFWFDQPFSYETDESKIYTAEEIDEAKDYVKSLREENDQ
jgi:hypothetical protein